MSRASAAVTVEIDRRQAQQGKLLDLLRARGSRGATNVELSENIGLRFTSRIFDLRKMGHHIVGAKQKGGLWAYWLLEQGRAPHAGAAPQEPPRAGANPAVPAHPTQLDLIPQPKESNHAGFP